MNSEKILPVEKQLNAIEKQKQLNAIDSLCGSLNFLASPDIEEKIGCSLECCLHEDITMKIDKLSEFYVDFDTDEPQPITGDVELALGEFYEKIADACCRAVDYGAGFSKTQHWLDFIKFINTLNILLEDEFSKLIALCPSKINVINELRHIDSLCEALDALVLLSNQKNTSPLFNFQITVTIHFIDWFRNPHSLSPQSLIGNKEISTLDQLKKTLLIAQEEEFFIHQHLLFALKNIEDAITLLKEKSELTKKKYLVTAEDFR